MLQAYLTRRKKDKIFAVYDLTIVLGWCGHWVENDKKASFLCPSTMKSHPRTAHGQSIYNSFAGPCLKGSKMISPC